MLVRRGDFVETEITVMVDAIYRGYSQTNRHATLDIASCASDELAYNHSVKEWVCLTISCIYQHPSTRI